jgi:hypothetical protein
VGRPPASSFTLVSIALRPAAILLNAVDPIVLFTGPDRTAVESPLLFEHSHFGAARLRKQR